MSCAALAASALDLSQYADTSKLATGKWVKVAVSESGIYQITSSDASKWGFNDLSRVRVFGYGGTQINDTLRTNYYVDDLRPFYEQRFAFLLDFNMQMTAKLCELLDITPNISLSEEYVKDVESGVDDFREVIRPKHPMPDADFIPKPYYQVYAQRHGFIPNLSILDLLFNMGNEALFYL